MDNTTILSWNVRGLNARARRDAVRTLVADIRPSIVCMQETKLSVIDQMIVSSLLGTAFGAFAYLPASNTRGGILIAARQPDVELGEVLIGCYSVTVSVQIAAAASTSPSWWLTSVYGVRTTGRRRQGTLSGRAGGSPGRMPGTVGSDRRLQPYSE